MVRSSVSFTGSWPLAATTLAQFFFGGSGKFKMNRFVFPALSISESYLKDVLSVPTLGIHMAPPGFGLTVHLGLIVYRLIVDQSDHNPGVYFHILFWGHSRVRVEVIGKEEDQWKNYLKEYLTKNLFCSLTFINIGRSRSIYISFGVFHFRIG